MSIDGYIAGPNGEMDWMVWNWEDRLKNHVFELTEPVDTIILGRKMTDGFVSYWSDIIMTKPDDPFYELAKKLIEIPKVVFTKTLKKEWLCLMQRYSVMYLRGRGDQVELDGRIYSQTYYMELPHVLRLGSVLLPLLAQMLPLLQTL